MSDTSKIDAWVHDLKPRNSVQMDLAVYAAKSFLKLDELREVEAAATAYHRRTAPERARLMRAEGADKLGFELTASASAVFIDSVTNRPDGLPPRAPWLVVGMLEATPEGCRWLADRWTRLREVLDEKTVWGTDDERLAVRLLGWEPGTKEVADVRTLRQAIAAEYERPASEPVEAKEILREICGRHLGRLQTREVERKALLEEGEARHNFDATPEGKELRRLQGRTFREMMKALGTLAEMQKPKREPKPEREAEASPSERPTGVSDPQESGRPDAPVGRSEDVPATPATADEYAGRWKEEARLRAVEKSRGRGRSWRGAPSAGKGLTPNGTDFEETGERDGDGPNFHDSRRPSSGGGRRGKSGRSPTGAPARRGARSGPSPAAGNMADPPSG